MHEPTRFNRQTRPRRDGSNRKPLRLGILLVMMSTLALTPLSLVLLASPQPPARADIWNLSRAAGHFGDVPYSAFTYRDMWFGTYELSGGVLGACISPKAQLSLGDQYADPVHVTSWINEAGLAVPEENMHALAYVSSMYDWNDPAIAAALRPVTWSLGYYPSSQINTSTGHTNSYVNLDMNTPGSFGDAMTKGSGQEALARAILAEAQNNWNGWDGTSRIAQVPDSGSTVTLGERVSVAYTLPGIRAGHEVIFILTAPDGTTVTATTVTDAADTASWGYVVEQYGTYTVTAQMVGTVAQSWPVISHPLSSASQTMLIGNQPKRSDDGDRVPVTVRAAATPSITTEVSQQLIPTGASLDVTDRIWITGGAPGSAFSGTTSLYGPFVSDQDSALADLSVLTPLGTVAFSGTYDAEGSARFISQSLRLNEPAVGVYVWSESLDGNELNLPSGPGPRGPETFIAAVPTITTSASDLSVLPGETVTDTAVVEGLYASVGGQSVTWVLSGRLLGPLSPGTDGTCAGLDWMGASVAATISETVISADQIVDGRATILGLGPFTTPNQRGCYTYSEELRGTSPDGSTVTATHPAGEEAQTVLVAPITVTAGGETLLSAGGSGGRSALATGLLALGAVSVWIVRRVRG